MGRTAKGRLQGHRAASSTVACVLREGPQTLPTPKDAGSPGRFPRPGNHRLSVWLEPQASKCRRANPAPFQYFFRGLLLKRVVFLPFF